MSVNASSHGRGVGGIVAPVGRPLESRAYIACASKSSSAAIPSTSRRNHGCQPRTTGIASVASTVNVASPEIWNDNGTLKVGSA